MQFTDLVTARRLEATEAALTGGFARRTAELRPGSGAFVEAVAGGWALCCGTASPLNKCSGLGLLGSVREEDLGRIEAMLRPSKIVVIDVCPLADVSLLEWTAGRGYAMNEIENVLVLGLAGRPAIESPPGVEVREARDSEAELWSRTVGQGFAGEAPLTDEMLEMGVTMFGIPGCRAYLAFVGGTVAGGAGFGVHERVAALYGTSVLPAFRGRRIQSALLEVRLRAATELGCDLAKIATRPGTVSQRNAERAGFRVVYSKPQVFKTLSS
jgi:GNAT superfamily N-acetyltransferase